MLPPSPALCSGVTRDVIQAGGGRRGGGVVLARVTGLHKPPRSAVSTSAKVYVTLPCCFLSDSSHYGNHMSEAPVACSLTTAETQTVGKGQSLHLFVCNT